MKFLSYIIACLVILSLVDYFSGTPIESKWNRDTLTTTDGRFREIECFPRCPWMSCPNGIRCGSCACNP
ncbi:unnamed protein product [Gordionus sp. m RMFG-2023]